MDKNTGYVPLVSPYGSNISFGGEQDSYWEQTTYLQNDIQPAHSAPFFQAPRDFMPNQGSQKSITAIDFASHPYQPYPTGMSNTTYAPTSSTLPQRTEATKRYREPPAKRQRTSALTQPILGSCSTAIFDTDQASICESASDCCTSCSGDDICDEPDCQPCDEPACVEAVEICSQESCSKPACQDECLSTAFRVQGSLGHSEILPEIIESKDGPWSSQLVRHDSSRTRESTHTRGNSAIDHSYLPTPPSVVDNSETPTSPYLPTPQSNTFGQHASYYQESPADLSGAGAIFNGTEDQWADASYTYDLNAPEVIPCNWEGCNVVCGSHNDWISHFHEVHIDPQMSFGCPIPQENCPPTMSINPIDHLQTVHGYNFDFSAGALSCPATTCPPEQTYYNPIAFHNHLDHYHATPVHGSLQCKLPTCGTEFDDPNQFFTHMSNHLHPFVPKEEEDIDLLTPPVSTGRISTGLEKVEVSADGDLPHLCKWKSKNEGICSHECTSASDLQDHIKNQHLTPLSKSTGYICQWEGCLRDSNLGEKAGFSQRGKLDRHMATHTGFKCSECPHCGQFFSAPQALKQHILLHTGEKPWKCKHCDKRFPQQSACTIHERTHTNEKPLECNVCGKKFSESSNLAKHRKIHGEKGLHVCAIPDCEKSFHRLDQLKRHALTHDKPPKINVKKRRIGKRKDPAATSDAESVKSETGI